MSKKEMPIGRVVVITGASSGFGKGVALELARKREKLVLVARRDDLIDELVATCRDLGSDALSCPADVGRPETIEEVGKKAVEAFGRIDVWINNAGIGAIGRFDRIPLADHRKVIETNLLGTLYGSWVAFQRFLQQGSGVLINVASELAEHTVPYYSSYAAAKHGIVGLDDSLRQELEQNGPEGVHVCTVLPTAHDTPFFDHAANYTGREIQAPKPLHDPADVVRAIVSLIAEPKDRTIVGSDGGFKVLLKRLLPGLSSKLDGKMMQKTQMENVPPAADSSGALRHPMPEGTGVAAGRRKKDATHGEEP